MERYGNTVFRLAYSYLKNRADAEDVMQETLLKLYLERKPFRSPEHERYWVVRAAVNESKKLLRSPVAQADRASGGGRGAGVRHAAAE